MTLPDTMLGLYKTAKGAGNMELREAPVPRPKNNEVLLEIKAAGICGTDIHIRHDKFPYWPPVIMGHEFSGVIIESGDDVTNFKVGDRVVGEPHTLACGKCEMCRTGNRQLCSFKRSPGWGIDGAFAKYLVMPEHLLHVIPDQMTFEEAAVVEPAANAVQDVLERGRVYANDTVVIFGPGPIGLLALMAARAGGAGKTIMVGTKIDQAMRLPKAKELGVDEIILADQQNAVEEILRITKGRGADLVVEASGSPQAIKASFGAVRRMGRISQIGLTGRDEISIPWDQAAWKVCDLFFNMSTGFTCWDRTIGLIASKKMDVSKIISHTAKIEDWERMFELVEKQDALKVVFTF
jgi:L-iditol 2-dehydrogenase